MPKGIAYPPSALNKKQVVEVIKYAIGLGLGCGLLWLAFKDIEVAQLQQDLAHVNLWYLLPGFVVGIMSHWLRAYRWTMLTEAAGHPTGHINAFWSVMVGYMANNAVPRLGEVTRCTMLARAEGIPFLAAMGTVVVERAIDVVFLLFFIGLVFLLEFDKVMAYFSQTGSEAAQTGSGIPWLWIAAGVLALGFAGVLVFRRKLLATALGAKVWKLVLTLVQSVLSIRKLRRVWLFVAVSFAIWLFYILFVYVMLLGMPGAEHTGFYFAFFLTVLGGIGMAMPVPGGLGPYHNAVLIGFTLWGLSAQLGVASALWLHTPQFLFAVAVGAIGYFVLILKKPKAHPNSPSQANSPQA